MIVVSDENKADLIDAYKSAACCVELQLGFAVPNSEDENDEEIVVDPAGVVIGLGMALSIIGLDVPEITGADIAEFKEMNSIE